MDFLQLYAKEIVALLVPFIAFVLSAPQRARPKLVFGIQHQFTFLLDPRDDAGNVVPGEKKNVRTVSMIFRNAGGGIAHNVEIIFNRQPQFLNMWPIRDHNVRILEDGRVVYTFKSFAAREGIVFEQFSLSSHHEDVITVRCDEGTGRQVKMVSMEYVQQWKIRMAGYLMLAGVAAVLYLIFSLIQFVLASGTRQYL